MFRPLFRFLPWDIWLAGAAALAAFLAAIFGPRPAIFILIYVFLCAYVVVKVTRRRPRDASGGDDETSGT